VTGCCDSDTSVDEAVEAVPFTVHVTAQAFPAAHAPLRWLTAACWVCCCARHVYCSIGLQGSEGIGLIGYNSATLVTLGGCPLQNRVYQYSIANTTTGAICANNPDTGLLEANLGPPSSSYMCQVRPAWRCKGGGRVGNMVPRHGVQPGGGGGNCDARAGGQWGTWCQGHGVQPGGGDRGQGNLMIVGNWDSKGKGGGRGW
jgi:hypothetical protein